LRRGNLQAVNAKSPAMDFFRKKPILPVEIFLALAINIVVAALGFYMMLLWRLLRG
jgi:hypothetical protein